MTHIDKSITQKLIHRLNFKATDVPKTVLDQLGLILAQEYPNKHEKLRPKAKRPVCNNDLKGLDQYIKGYQKV